MKRFYESVKVGPPLAPTTLQGMPFCYGALQNEAHLTKVTKFVENAVKDGAKLVTGGKRLTEPSELQKGLFYAPTLFTDVPQQSELFQQEVFGPVSLVSTFKTFDEAIALANAVDYGLAAIIWTNNMKYIMQASRQIRAGYITVNKFAPPSVVEVHTFDLLLCIPNCSKNLIFSHLEEWNKVAMGVNLVVMDFFNFWPPKPSPLVISLLLLLLLTLFVQFYNTLTIIILPLHPGSD